MTAEGRAKAAELIRRRNEVRYGTGPRGSIQAVSRTKRR
jgi:hypothetical protein